MNLAALWKLPVIFICENNRYAMGTALERALAQTEIWKFGRGLQHAGEAVDGMDVLAVREVVGRAVARARDASKAPALIEARTYRFRGHSMRDPAGAVYRTKEEVEQREAARPDRDLPRARACRRWPRRGRRQGDREGRRRPGGRGGGLRRGLAGAAASGCSPTRTGLDRHHVQRVRWPEMAVMTLPRGAQPGAARGDGRATPACSSSARRSGSTTGAYKVTQGLLKDFGPQAGGRHADRGVRLHRRRAWARPWWGCGRWSR